MYAGDATCQIFITFARHNESCLLDHILEFLLGRESLDALHEVLIAVSISRHQLADQWYCAEAPPLVDCIEDTTIDMTEFETCEYTTWL